MSIDMLVVNPETITVTPSLAGSYPKINFTNDIRILLNSWSQLEQLRDSITKALDDFYASELRDEGVGL